MGANSLTRRVAKALLYPIMTEKVYVYAQALTMAWDIRRGDYPEAELSLLPVLVRPGDTVLDLGANFGFYSYPLSRAVGVTGKVYAFEPIAFTHRSLRIVTKLLRCRNIEIVPKGCSDRAGPIAFEVPIQANGAFSAGLAHDGGRKEDRPGKETHVRWSATRRVMAEMIRLDDFLPPLDNLSFVKADIEGAEVFAFRGAEKTIAKYLPTVLCEINPWYLEGFGFAVSDLTNFFFDKGYRLYHYDGRRLAPREASSVVEANYLFLHPSRAGRLQSVLAG